MGRGSYSSRGRGGPMMDRGRGRGRGVGIGGSSGGGYYSRPHGEEDDRPFNRPRAFERSQVREFIAVFLRYLRTFLG